MLWIPDVQLPVARPRVYVQGANAVCMRMHTQGSGIPQASGDLDSM